MIRKNRAAILEFCIAVVLTATFSTSVAKTESFDKPLRQKVIDLGHSPYLMPKDNRHIKLTCDYYPDFMIKELNDPGNEGALWIGISPARPGQVPPCVKGRGQGEKVFKDWDGYFGGVKRNLVILYDSDGTDGGIGFHIFDSRTMAKIFEDSVSLSEKADDLDFVTSSASQITMRYLRVVSGSCSVPKDGSACWTKLKEKAGLRNSPIPRCDYQHADETDPSVIAYAVEVSLYPTPSIKALSNTAKCYPAD